MLCIVHGPLYTDVYIVHGPLFTILYMVHVLSTCCIWYVHVLFMLHYFYVCLVINSAHSDCNSMGYCKAGHSGRTVTIYDSSFIHCMHTNRSADLDRLEWLQNGQVYSVQGDLSGSQLTTLVLRISDITYSHEGEYSCRAVLTDGSIAGPVSAGFLQVLGNE